MIIPQPKFEVGHKVWHCVIGTDMQPCDICDSNGQLELRDRKFECPQCYGKKAFCPAKRTSCTYPDSQTIVGIRIHADKNGSVQLRYIVPEFKWADYDFYDVIDPAYTMTEEEVASCTYEKALQDCKDAVEEIENKRGETLKLYESAPPWVS